MDYESEYSVRPNRELKWNNSLLWSNARGLVP